MLGLYQDTEILTEAEKNKEDYLMRSIDLAIAELVVEKDWLKKAYNYYNGQRDQDQFKYLEENFNIGTPTSVEFIPLVRRHIDALVGEHLQNKIKPKITCKDKTTLTHISDAKNQKVNDAEVDMLKTQLMENIHHMLRSQDERNSMLPPTDNATESEIQKLRDQVSADFISEYEIAAQNVLFHLTQSKSVDLYHKFKTLFLDILIAGQCFYKVTIVRQGETPKVEVLNPFDVFFDRNPSSPYVKTSPRVVHRRWMYKDQILNRYGEYLDSSDIDELQTIQPAFFNNDYYYIRGESGALVSNAGAGMNFNLPYLDGRNYSYNLVPVYEVEWLTTNKETVDGKTVYRMDRYSGVRVGENIYIDMGKDEPIRSVENPYECFNTINGMFYSDRNGNPYSLVLATANLQDTYDILHFHRDSLIANSGVRGDFLDISQLPTFLGSSPAERIMKWKAYKKQGLAPINTAQEGRGANHNTIYAGYDDTVSGQAIQAIQLVIQATEDTCSSITGVFRERLGAIEQKDAVTNVDVGIKQSAIITKQYYQVMDNVTTELLIDALNACKESYKDGMIGSIILGNDKQKVFSIEPIYFSFTDYDIHIADSGDVIRDMQKIDQLTVELIKSGQADIDIIFATVGTESMTELKQQVLGAFGKKKQENNVVQQLQQQLQQMQQQLQQTQKQAQQLSSENEALKGKNTQLEAKAIEYDYDVRKEANRINRTYNDERIDVDKQNLAIEEAQLYDGDPQNDKVNKSKI